jgi:hypothetical protein
MSKTKSRWASLRETISGLFATPEQPTELKKSVTVIINSTEASMGERPSTTFADQVLTFKSDALLREGCIETAEQILGQGFYIIQDEKYTFAPNGVTAKDIIDEWNRVNNVDESLMTLLLDIVAFGESIFLLNSGGFDHLPIECIAKAVPVDKTIPIRQKFNLETTPSFGSKKINWGEFVPFKIYAMTNSPFGEGCIAPIMRRPAPEIPSLMELRNSIRKNLDLSFKKQGNANELWAFDCPDASIKELQEKITKMSETGNRLASNVKGTISIAIAERATSFDIWLKTVSQEFLQALSNPTLRLGIESYYTKASSEVGAHLFEFKIGSIRRMIQRKFEILYSSVLTKAGYDAQKAGIRMIFGANEPAEYVIADIFTAVEKELLSKEEGRNLLIKQCRWRIESAKPPKEDDKVEQ